MREPTKTYLVDVSSGRLVFPWPTAIFTENNMELYNALSGQYHSWYVGSIAMRYINTMRLINVKGNAITES